MKIINFKDFDNEAQKEFFGKIEFEDLKDTEKIILDVKNNGDSALLSYCEKFGDGKFNSAEDFLVTEEEINSAFEEVGDDTIMVIEQVVKNVKSFAKKQLECIRELKFEKCNSTLGHKIIPLENVLCYVPGGNYPLPSSAVMTAVPAKAAGVKNIYLTSPRIKPQTIVAASLSGVDKIYRLGGAQAVSAFAFGTQTIRPVDKIVGPGNKYVTYAKKYVYGQCSIDFLAGPSEVLVVADDNANPELVSADILAQCEHDLDARGYLLCFSEEFAKKVQDSALRQLENLDTKEIASKAFEKSIAVVVESIDEAVQISNKRAPEHLELMFDGAEKFSDKFTNYGSLFIGENCAEVFGDYCSGTNHVLPTNQAARYTGGLSVFDFIKIQTYQNIDKAYAQELSCIASPLAAAEGLSAHKLASDLRGKI